MNVFFPKNKEVVQDLLRELRAAADKLSANERLFAGLILGNLRQEESAGAVWILESLDMPKLPIAQTPAHKAVEEISAYKGKVATNKEMSLIASVSLLKALNQYGDLLKATEFLQKTSEIFASAAERLGTKVPSQNSG